jgi:hypothetical protein
LASITAATVATCYPHVNSGNSISLVPSYSRLLSNRYGMDNKEIRRANMLALAEEFGGLAALAEKTGTDAKYLSQVKNRWNGRGMGDDVARRIERKLEKPKGWMDVLHTKNHSGDAHLPTAREEMILLLFRGLTPEQQRELVLETNAMVLGNSEIQRRFLDKPLRTFSNEEVEAAYGLPQPEKSKKRPSGRKRRGVAEEEDPE